MWHWPQFFLHQASPQSWRYLIWFFNIWITHIWIFLYLDIWTNIVLLTTIFPPSSFSSVLASHLSNRFNSAPASACDIWIFDITIWILNIWYQDMDIEYPILGSWTSGEPLVQLLQFCPSVCQWKLIYDWWVSKKIFDIEMLRYSISGYLLLRYLILRYLISRYLISGYLLSFCLSTLLK